MRRVPAVVAVTAAFVAGLSACAGGTGDTPARTDPSYPDTADPVVWVVGDLCEAFEDPEGCDDVNALIRADEATEAVLLVGDAQYEEGTLQEYEDYYDEQMAPGLRDLTWPTVGNHDYNTSGASGYWDYWGDRAGRRGEGWYSFTLGRWRVVAANSTCGSVGGCFAASDQGEFIRSALAESERCELVFAHYPFLSDGKHGDSDWGAQLFATTYAAGGDLYLSGHDHTYQRFAPKRPDGTDDPTRGVRSMVIGTGGADLHDWADTDRTEYRQNTDLGALRLVLGKKGYTGTFVSVTGETMDSFSGSCH